MKARWIAAVIGLVLFAGGLSAQDDKERQLPTVNLMVPNSSRIQGNLGQWKIDDISLGPNSSFESENGNKAPIKPHKFSNGDVGYAAVVNPTNASTFILLKRLPVPLSKLQTFMKSKNQVDLLEVPVRPYDDKYSLLDEKGASSTTLRVGTINETGEIGIKDGQLLAVMESRDSFPQLYKTPGIRFIYETGVASEGKRLVKGTVTFSYVLQTVEYKDKDGNVQTVKGALVPLFDGDLSQVGIE